MKSIFKKPNGDEVIDLTKRSFDRNLVDTRNIQVFVTEEDHAMRPDLIAKDVYLDYTKWDGILKFNGISNPFSIDSRRAIAIPQSNDLDKGFKGSSEIVDRAQKKFVSQVLNPITKQDKKRLEMLKTKPLPNNILDSTDRNIKVKDGKIYFGEDLTKVNKERCTGSVTRANLKERLLKNLIFQE